PRPTASDRPNCVPSRASRRSRPPPGSRPSPNWGRSNADRTRPWSASPPTTPTAAASADCAASGVGALASGACCTWPLGARSAPNRPCSSAIRHSEAGANAPRWPWSPACAPSWHRSTPCSGTKSPGNLSPYEEDSCSCKNWKPASGRKARKLFTSIAIKRYDAPVPARPPAMTSISFEFYPPKTDEQRAQLDRTVARLREHSPEYVSCTFGAGGSTLSYTADTVRHLLQTHALDAAPHLSCVGGTCEEIAALLDRYRALGCRRVVALRGDLP